MAPSKETFIGVVRLVYSVLICGSDASTARLSHVEACTAVVGAHAAVGALHHEGVAEHGLGDELEALVRRRCPTRRWSASRLSLARTGLPR